MSTTANSPESTGPYRGLIGISFEETAITLIDGVGGQLYHRGYSIDSLASRPFEQVAQLLIEGEYPTDEKDHAFSDRLKASRELPADLAELTGLLVHSPPETALQTVVSALSNVDHERFDAPALLALMPEIVVAHSALRDGVEIPKPNSDLGIAADCLQRIVRRPLSALEQQIINLDFVLHADHGANASSFVARIAKSTFADTCRCITAAIATFSGERHGGAVKRIMEILLELGDTPGECEQYVKERLSKKQAVIGFGHRVYKVEDPRARLFREAAVALSDENNNDVYLSKLDALVSAMKPFERAGIAPNVDLYAAAVYLLLGIKPDQATALFAVARTAGWLAQILEQGSGSNVLIRPRLEYKGHTPRELT